MTPPATIPFTSHDTAFYLRSFGGGWGLESEDTRVTSLTKLLLTFALSLGGGGSRELRYERVGWDGVDEVIGCELKGRLKSSVFFHRDTQ